MIHAYAVTFYYRRPETATALFIKKHISQPYMKYFTSFRTPVGRKIKDV